MTAPSLGLAEAAKACGVSESTIRRRRPELLEAGATQTPKGWAIPVPALVELGLLDRRTMAPGGNPAAEPVPGLAESSLLARVEALREALAAAEQRAAVAEAIAAERERIIDAQATALRMLEAPKTSRDDHVRTSRDADVTNSREEEPAAASYDRHMTVPAKRRWWQL